MFPTNAGVTSAGRLTWISPIGGDPSLSPLFHSRPTRFATRVTQAKRCSVLSLGVTSIQSRATSGIGIRDRIVGDRSGERGTREHRRPSMQSPYPYGTGEPVTASRRSGDGCRTNTKSCAAFVGEGTRHQQAAVANVTASRARLTGKVLTLSADCQTFLQQSEIN